MGIDEYEVIRLIDWVGLTQEECAAQINVARTTVTGIYNSARHKLADASFMAKTSSSKAAISKFVNIPARAVTTAAVPERKVQRRMIPMSENCTHDCSSCGSSCAQRNQPQSLQAAPHEGSHIKHVIAVVSGKGGVGKSLVTSLML